MHAYLILGDPIASQNKATSLAKKLKAKAFEFPLAKIEDVRELNSFVSLTLTQPTAIILTNVDESTTEAMNAFLKNLEEPQEDLWYILTASNLHSVVPTIISRCQVISLIPEEHPGGEKSQMAEKFLDSSVGEKLKEISELKDRDSARKFTTDLILGCHELMISKDSGHTIYSKAIRAASFTKGALEANGQVTIQLTNMVISLV